MKNEIDRHDYTILNNNMTRGMIKYEIGKIYEIPEGRKENFPKIFYRMNSLNENQNLNNFDQDQKLFEIKILNFISGRPVNFKILRECDYKEVSKRKPTLFNSIINFNEIISAIKLNDEKILDMILELCLSNCNKWLYARILVKTNIDKYQEKLLKDDSILTKRTLSLFTNRNNILDKLIKMKDKETAINIIEKGINKYLDFYSKKFSNDVFVFKEILKQGRFKDIDYFLKSKTKDDYNLLNSVILAGIDKYLDCIIKLDEQCLYDSIVDIGRKKDLDHILKNKDDGIYYFIAKQGFDEHLDIISKTSRDKETLKEVLQHERECDLWLKNKLKRDE